MPFRILTEDGAQLGDLAESVEDLPDKPKGAKVQELVVAKTDKDDNPIEHRWKDVS